MKYITRLVSIATVVVAVLSNSVGFTNDTIPAPLVVERAIASIKDVHGGPLPEKVAPGSVLFVSAASAKFGTSPRSIRWTVSPKVVADRTQSFRSVTMATGQEVGPLLIVPTGLEDTVLTIRQVVALGDDSDEAEIQIVVTGHGPRPPPTPIPDPIPPTPPIPQNTKLSLIVIEDVANRTVATALVLNATTAWNELKTSGHDWQFYDRATTEIRGKKYVAEVGPTTLPALLIRDRERDEKLTVVPLPQSTTELKNLAKKWSGAF